MIDILMSITNVDFEQFYYIVSIIYFVVAIARNK